MRDERIYMVHILECIKRVQSYTSDGKRVLLESTLIQDAVLRNLQVLAESTQRIPEHAKSRHPEVPWRQIAAFRNRLTHDYLGVDLDIVWSVVETELPQLRDAVETMLAERGIDFTTLRDPLRTLK